jgi:hypothetical protein
MIVCLLVTRAEGTVAKSIMESQNRYNADAESNDSPEDFDDEITQRQMAPQGMQVFVAPVHFIC